MKSNNSVSILKADAFLVMPIILVVIVFAIQTLLFSSEMFFIFALPLALLSPIIELVFLYLGIKKVIRRHYKSAISLIFAIPLLMAASGIPFLYGGYALHTSRYIKVSLNEKQYIEEILLTQPDERGFRFKEFSWGGFMSNPVTLVYDESDELALPEEQRSKSWWDKVGASGERNSEFSRCRYSVQKIKSHFYVVDFGC